MIKMKDTKFNIYKKTPFLKTIGHVLLLSEATNMIYNTVDSSKPVMDFINFHKELYTSNVLPLFNSGFEYLINNDIKSGLIGVSVLIGTGVSTGLFNKFRGHIPNDEKFNEEKSYFLQEKINKIHNYIKLPTYLIAGSTALTSLISGTYNSFFQNNLNLLRNTSEISNNYSSLFVPIATIAAVYSSKPFFLYTSNMLRGIYEKVYMLYDSVRKSIFNLYTEENNEIQTKRNEIPIIKIEETIDLKTGINLYYFDKIENEQTEIVAYIRNDVPLDSEHKITPYLNEDVIKEGNNYFYFPGSKGKIEGSIFLDVNDRIVELINSKSSTPMDFKVKDLEKKVNLRETKNKNTIKK